MDRISKKLQSELGIFLYKVSNDILLVLIISFILLLIAEGIMPGLVSAYLSFTKLILVLFSVLGAIIYLGKINNITFESDNKPLNLYQKVRGKKTLLTYSLLVLFVLLIINSLLKFAWWEIGITAISSIFLLLYLKKAMI